MNALYVTVSIPILLVLAGFNHAHGLTTFGKSNNQGQGNSAQGTVQGKHCTSQANCTFIKGTTCIRQYCLCGDNTHPANGICRTTSKWPGHICQKDDECVDNALCLVQDENPKSNVAPTPAPYKICQCLDNKTSTPRGCSGGTNLVILPGLLLVSIVVVRAY